MDSSVTVLILVEAGRGARLRAVLRLMFGKWVLRRADGVRFAKMLGSGRGGGFLPAPSLVHQGALCVFETQAQADAFLAHSAFVAGCRRKAAGFLTATLVASSSRGLWAGDQPFAVLAREAPDTVVASLTRASIRPRKAQAFWRHAPGAQASLHAAEGCLLAVGLGEAPVFRQATFTIWENPAALAAYAHQGAHRAAIAEAKREGFFSESLFARFVVREMRGTWQGRSFGA
jgi:heme-degrading monooxygenase HmoA